MLKRSCVNCRYYSASLEARAAVQLGDLAKLVVGEPKLGASIPAFMARLNQSLCGTPGYWFAENPPPPPETKELPATAG